MTEKEVARLFHFFEQYKYISLSGYIEIYPERQRLVGVNWIRYVNNLPKKIGKCIASKNFYKKNVRVVTAYGAYKKHEDWIFLDYRNQKFRGR